MSGRWGNLTIHRFIHRLSDSDAAFVAETLSVVFPVVVVLFDGWAGLFAAGGEDAFSGGPLADHVGGGGEWCSCWWWGW